VRLAVFVLGVFALAALLPTAVGQEAGGATQTAAPGAEDLLATVRDIIGGNTGGGGIIIAILAFMAAIAVYLWFGLPSWLSRGGKKAVAGLARVEAPKGYDFIAYVVDAASKTISKERYVKISESLYMSTNLSKPSFLYVPEEADTYICRDGKAVVPCGIAYKEGMLTMLLDPKLAGAHELAASSRLISIEEGELDKLLAELYKKGERKMHEVPISPDTRIGFTFNIKNMIRGYLDVLRQANEMMIHFLNTANQAESIEKFMRAAAKLQETRFTWLKWVVYLIMAAGIAAALFSVVGGGG